MPYATKPAMLARFREKELIELTNKSETPTGAIVDAVLDAAMADADSDIDRACASAGYVVPLASAHAFIVRAACDIARWNLYTRMGTEVKDTEPRLRYEDAKALLRDIAEGDMIVPGAALAEAGSDAPAAAGSRTLTFGAEFEGQYDVRGAV